MNEHQKAARAARQVAAITAFYIHLLVFSLVIVILSAVNMITSPEAWWVQWVFLGWGVGVLAHALAVFARAPAFVTNWQLRKIKELKDTM